MLHVFNDADRATYVDSVRSALVAGGRYHLIVFSDAQPGTWGPRRLRRDELTAVFATGWEVRSVDAATFELTIGSAQAWRVTAVRTD